MEIDYFGNFKPIRNKLRKFHRDWVITILVNSLFDAYTSSKSRIETFLLPWELLFLLSEVITDSPRFYGRKQFTKDHLNQFIKMIRSFRTIPDSYISAVDHKKFFRSTAFQQFWLQQPIRFLDIVRSSYIVENCNWAKYKPSERISEQFGLDVSEVNIVFFCLFALLEKNNHFTIEDLGPLFKKIEKDKLASFIKQFSKTQPQLKSELQANSIRVKDYGFKMHAIQAIWDTSLLRNGSNLLCIYQPLFTRQIQFWLFRKLKDIDGRRFIDGFSKAFEDYISKILDWAELDFIRESEIKHRISDEKHVDFLISIEDTHLIIEAKAIEARPLLQASQSEPQLKNEYRKTLTKGVLQALVVGRDMKNAGYDLSSVYAIVVTYRQTYFSFATDTYDEFMKEEIDAFFSENNPESTIPLQRIFFCDVGAFELICSIAKKSKEELVRYLTTLGEHHIRVSGERKYTIDQLVIPDTFDQDPPSFIRPYTNNLENLGSELFF